MWQIQPRPHSATRAAVIRPAPEVQMKCMYDTRLAWLLTSYFIMCIGVGPTTCPRYLISRNVRQILLSEHRMDLTGKRVFNVMEYSIGHTSLFSLLWYDMRPNSCNAKECTTRGNNGNPFHIAFCHRSHNVVCFVLPSCCSTAGSDPIVILPNTFVHCVVTYNRYCSVPSPHKFLRWVGRPAKYKLWPIRHWGGEADPIP